MKALEELRRVAHFGGLTDEQVREVLEEGFEKFVPAREINGREGEPVWVSLRGGGL